MVIAIFVFCGSLFCGTFIKRLFLVVLDVVLYPLSRNPPLSSEDLLKV